MLIKYIYQESETIAQLDIYQSQKMEFNIFSIFAFIIIITSAIWVNLSMPINDKLNKVLKVVKLIH